MTCRATWIAWALLGAATLCAIPPAPAAAQQPPAPSAAARDKARKFANEGLRFYKEGRYKEAIDSFTQAEILVHAPTVVIYLARSYEKLGWLMQAESRYQEILNETYTGSSPREFRAAQEQAKAELEALKPRIPTLQIVMRGVPSGDLEVVVDNYPVRGPALQRPIRLNPGEHTVILNQAGRPHEHRTITLKDEERQEIFLDVGGAGTASSSRPAPGEAPPAEAPPGEDRSPAIEAPATEGSLVPAAIAFTAGAVGLGLGAAMGAAALGKVSDLDARCPGGRCGDGSVENLSEAASDRAAAETLGTISTISFIAGGAAMAAGVILAAVRPGGGPAEIEVGAGPRWVSVRGRF